MLHLHEPMAPGPTMTAMLIKPAPIVATFHAAGSSLAYEVFKPFTSRGSHRIDIRFAVSDDAAALAQAALGGTYERAFNGVEIERFSPDESAVNDPPTIFFLARHEQRKGLAVLLEAAAGLSAPFRLIVGGDGPETTELRSRYQSDHRIEWIGEIGDDEKMQQMRHADIFCAPSLHGESFGIVLLEAMAAHTAVVASSLPGYQKVIVCDDGRQAGALVPPSDPNALRDTLRDLLGNADARSRYVEIGKERVQTFSMAALADLYTEAYERTLLIDTPNLHRARARRGGRRPIMGSPRRLR